jgi:hypothetical protein
MILEQIMILFHILEMEKLLETVRYSQVLLEEILKNYTLE